MLLKTHFVNSGRIFLHKNFTGGKWRRRTCSAFRTTAIKRPLSAPSISASISTIIFSAVIWPQIPRKI